MEGTGRKSFGSKTDSFEKVARSGRINLEVFYNLEDPLPTRLKKEIVQSGRIALVVVVFFFVEWGDCCIGAGFSIF